MRRILDKTTHNRWVISYGVARRTREIGVRIALGAQPIGVLGLILAGGTRLAAIGIAIGTVVSLFATRLLQGFLYEVSPTDPMTFAGIIGLLVSVTFFTSPPSNQDQPNDCTERMTVPIGARLRQNASAMKTESEVGTKNVDTEFRIQNLEVAGVSASASRANSRYESGGFVFGSGDCPPKVLGV